MTDPDFPEGPPLPVAAEAERWKVGDKAALMQAGRQEKAAKRRGGVAEEEGGRGDRSEFGVGTCFLLLRVV